MTPLRLGIIGMSEGNGHPYSWSAICNGYEASEMELCGFPGIPRYLGRQCFPEDAIPDVRVTHVWTQDEAVSQHIARASRIGRVVVRPADMIGEVDGILLARDDAETHFDFARPFLEAGLPVYIDKPFALSRADADRLLRLQGYSGQLFSCSALRYAPELQLTPEVLQEIGQLQMIHGVSPKYWDTYAVHVIEPLLLMIPDRGAVTESRVWHAGEAVTLQLAFGSGTRAQVTTTGSAAAPIGLRLFGSRGWKDLHFTDTFGAFKRALEVFAAGVRCRRDMVDRDFLLDVAGLIELGRKGIAA